MNNLTDLLLQFPPITAVGLQVIEDIPAIYSARDCVYNLQMAYYWAKHARDELNILNNETTIISAEGQDEVKKFTIPRLNSTDEKLEYLKKELTYLSSVTYAYSIDTPLPTSITYKVRRAYDKTMEALFNTELTVFYYGNYKEYQQRGIISGHNGQ